MKKTLYLLLLLFSFISSFAQNVKTRNVSNPISKYESIDTEIKNAKLLASSDPKESSKKLQALKEKCEKEGYNDGAMKCSMGLLLLYYNGGDYKKTIEESRFVEKYAQQLQNYEYISDVYRMRSNSYSEIGLLKQSLEELDKAVTYSDKIESENLRYYRKALIYESYAGTYEKLQNPKKQIFYRQKSVTESNKIPGKDRLSLNAKYQNLAYQYSSMAIIYSDLKVNDSASYYFDKALKIQDSNKYDIYDDSRATLLSDMAKFYSANGKYSKAISFAKRAEKLERHVSLPYIRKDIYQTLFNSYVETKKQDSTKYYLRLYTILSDSMSKSEKESIMTPVKQIISDKEAESKSNIKTAKIISVIVILIMALIGWIYWKRKNKNLHRKYEALIAKIQNKEASGASTDFLAVSETVEKTENNEIKSTVNIPDGTAKALLQKLEKFEASEKYLKKEANLTWLANHLNTNTKYLSEIIKIYRGKSFSNYINGLRINYIVHKLYNEPQYREYKINHLVEESGFVTYKVFVVAFKNEHGVTPSYFIQNLRKDQA